MDTPKPKKKKAVAGKKESAARKKPASADKKTKPKKPQEVKKGKAVADTKLDGMRKIEDSETSGSDANAGIDSPSSRTGDSRTQYEKLVNPQNYHEYMRASRFRGGSGGGGGRY